MFLEALQCYIKVQENHKDFFFFKGGSLGQKRKYILGSFASCVVFLRFLVEQPL